MKIETCIKESFIVIGKEGSTLDGHGFVKRLWLEASHHFNEVSSLAKKDDYGQLVGFWGAMSDFSRSFSPWEDNFSKGLYLAGVECNNDAQAPEGWTKWIIPSYEYIYVANESADTFMNVIDYMKQNNIPLVGAAFDYTCPLTNKNYIYFPIKKITA